MRRRLSKECVEVHLEAHLEKRADGRLILQLPTPFTLQLIHFRTSHFKTLHFNLTLTFNFNPLNLTSTIMSSNITHISDASFEAEVLNADGPVLIDYWAEWCAPCKMIAPILDELAAQYAGRIKIVKLDIEENPLTPPKYGIRGIPTLMLFKNGKVEDTKVGAVSKSQLASFIESHLEKSSG